MSSLRKLGFCYLASASVFAMAATLAAHPDLGALLHGRGAALAGNFRALVLDPAAAFAGRQDMTFFDAPYVSARLDLDADVHDGPRVRLALAPAGMDGAGDGTSRAPHVLGAPQFAARAEAVIVPDLAPLPPPAAPDIAAPQAPLVSAPRFTVAPEAPLPSDAAPPPAAELAALRLKDSLSPEMLRNFELFLYVSKAVDGPVAQRMYVFAKENGALKLAYDWAASTGRERPEIAPSGRRSTTDTPHGYYELDPSRMYTSYHSVTWDQSMPFAMFFNWERQGLQTGLAIHAATGGDIARLGTRASAGCVHLSPEHAATLYHLIHDRYRGEVPRFAYDAASQTSSNDGSFARGPGGNLKMAEGYKVLIYVEDFGGDNAMAALY